MWSSGCLAQAAAARWVGRDGLSNRLASVASGLCGPAQVTSSLIPTLLPLLKEMLQSHAGFLPGRGQHRDRESGRGRKPAGLCVRCQ